ncbi:ABC transporter permease, partial [Fructobacillus tropaeoli]|uniref:ABC transporter permease n=1 Tax=Fructobacillus tropaeoli TaxID=709323 RepID=UPI001942CA78
QKITKFSYYWMIVLPILLAIVGIAFQQYSQKESKSSTESKPIIAIIASTNIERNFSEQAPINYKNSDIHNISVAKTLMSDNTIDAILKVDDDFKNVSLKSNKELNTPVLNEIKYNLTQVKINKKASQLSISNATLNNLLSPVTIKSSSNALQENQEKKQSAQNISQTVTILLFFFLTSYITITGSEIGKEKGQHILQSILSAIPAKAYFKGKLLGIIYLIAFQVLAYVILYGIASLLLPLFHQEKLINWSSLQNITNTYIFAVIILALLTMLIYILFAAILASFVSRIEDVSQATSGVTTLLILPYFFSFFSQSQPNNILSVILSYIPFTSYAIMPTRIANNVVGIQQVAISILITLIFTIVMYKLAA